MHRHNLAILSAIFLFAGCGGLETPEFDSLVLHQPRVVSVDPKTGAIIKSESTVSVEFSEMIDPLTVDSQTLAVLKIDDDAKSDELVAKVVRGDAKGIEGLYELKSDGHLASFRPDEPFVVGSRYKIVATKGIMSVDMLPLSQRPGDTSAPFVSEFIIEEGLEGDAESSASAGPSGENAGSQNTTTTPTLTRPQYLVLNEIAYDATGDDLDGKEFIELFGDEGADIGGYKVLLIGGTDGTIKETIAIGAGAKIPEDGVFVIADSKTGKSKETYVENYDFIDNFDPQNGSDCVQLLDEKGNFLDAMCYGTPTVTFAKNGLACLEGQSAPKASAGKSLSRTNGVDTNDNSADFTVLALPTPGVK